MPQDRLGVFAYLVESFSTAAFSEDILSFSPYSLILVFNRDGIRFEHAPRGYKYRPVKTIPFFSLKRPRLNRFFYPFVFLVVQIRIFCLFFYICWKYRPKIAIIENTYAAGLCFILRKCGLFEKLIYIPGDWLAGAKTASSPWSYFGLNKIFPLFDFLACWDADVVLDCTQEIKLARRDFWGRAIAKNEIVFENRLQVKTRFAAGQTNRHKILFLGQIRQDSGLEIVIKALALLKNTFDVNLKIIGPENEQRRRLMILARQERAEERIEFLGFIERADFDLSLADCFCGLNLITREGSFSSKTLPSKIFDYLQYLLPVIATQNVGPAAEIIKARKLGLIIKPGQGDCAQAITEIYKNQALLRANIAEYIAGTQKNNISQFFDAQF